MHWFPLTLICAISLAAADALTKKYLSDYQGWEILIVRFGITALLMLPATLLHPIPAAPPEFNGLMALLIPMEITAMLLYMLAIRDSPLSHTLPYLAFTPVFNIVTGWLLLGETISTRGLYGILLVVAGSYILNLEYAKSWSWKGVTQPLRMIVVERGSRLMLGVAMIYSVSSVLGKQAMQYATPMTFGTFYYTVVGLVLLALVAILKPASLKILGQRPAPHLLIGILMAIMVTTHFLAIAQIEVAYMVAVKRSSLLFGMLFGAIFFAERHLERHLLAGSLMVAGVTLILT